MEGVCEDCGDTTLICVTCSACIKCHDLSSRFCVLEDGIHKHYIVKTGVSKPTNTPVPPRYELRSHTIRDQTYIS